MGEVALPHKVDGNDLVSKQNWIEKFRMSRKYSSKLPPWEDNVTHWNITEGSKFYVWAFGADNIRFPLSKFRVVINLTDLKSKYMEMLTEMQNMYSAVVESSLKIKRHFRVGQYAVAWIRERKRFYRVRLLDEDEPGIFDALTLDSGQVIPVRPERLYPICEQFLELRSMVVKVRLDGLQHFDYAKPMLRLMKEVRWGDSILEFDVTIVVKKTIYGELRIPGCDSTINSSLLHQYWRFATGPALPEVGQSDLECIVTHAEKDGTVFVQLPSPMLLALQDYYKEAEASIGKMLSDPEEYLQRKAAAPLDPKTVYLAMDNSKLLRVMVRPDMNGRHKSSELERVELLAIDVGKRMLKDSSCVLVASKVHPFLHQVPAQGVRARMVGIDSLDVKGFFKEYKILSQPFKVALQTVSGGTNGRADEIELFKEVEAKGRRARRTKFVSLNSELIKLKIGIARSEAVKEVIKKSRDRISTQVEFIDMKQGNQWNPSRVNKITTGSDIMFQIISVVSSTELVIQPVRAAETIQSISKEIVTYLSHSWIQRTLLAGQKKSYRRYFYAYMSKEKGLAVRTLLVEKHRDHRAKVLIIDFAEIVEVDSRDLILALPFSVLNIGPQAARVEKFDSSFLQTDEDPKDLKSLEGQICQACVKSVNYEKYGMAVFQLSSLKVFKW